MLANWRWKCAQFVERIWWRNYLKKKDVTAYLAWKKSYWTNLLAKCTPYLHLPASASVLDAGCGPAGIFMVLEQFRVQAFDPLIDKYETDLPHFNKALYPWVRFTQASLEEFSTVESFDAVFCMNAINHVRDIEQSVDKLVSFGHSGSTLVLTIDAHNVRFLKKLFALLPGDILHPHQYTLEEYQRMLTGRNCRILSCERMKHTTIFDHYLLIAKKN